MEIQSLVSEMDPRELGRAVLVGQTAHFTKARVEAQLEIHPLASPQAWIHMGKGNSRVLNIHPVTQSSTDLG